MKKEEYFERYGFEEKFCEEVLEPKIPRKGIVLSRNYKTNRIRVMWDGTTYSSQYHPDKIKEITKEEYQPTP
jgi:hypothetical protein